MGKIYCLMGKSASGKDTLYQRLLNNKKLRLKSIVPYTTRPIREGEVDGETYHFCTAKEADQMQKEGRVIEMRTYQTVHGPWSYFTADDGQIDLKKGNFLLIGTLEVYEKLVAYFGAEHIVPLYIHVDDGQRLLRAVQREMKQAEPKYAELCRRFLADEEDFSKEKQKSLGISKVFENTDVEQVTAELENYILERMN